MVLQQQADVAIWGRGEPGEKVSLSASWGETSTTVTDNNGKWSLTLQTPKARPGNAQSHTLSLEGNNRINIENVLLGEVWLASGQSNMEWKIKQLKLSAKQLGDSKQPLIREYRVTRNATSVPALDTQGHWKAASGETIGDFAATSWFFAYYLHQALDVPIGIINSSWGGTPIESWLSRQAQSAHEPTQAMIASMDRWLKNYDPTKSQQKFESDLAKWQEQKAEAERQGLEFSLRKPRLATPESRAHRYPGNLYAGMIYPLKPYTIKGAIWYQGEANSHSTDQAMFYEQQLTDLINSWRNDWQYTQMPFYVVQLANFRAPQIMPVEAEQFWPVTRESMRKTTGKLAHTGMAVAIDIGEAKNIHPKNKREVGRRLALLALHDDYGHDIVPSGPLFRSHVVEGDKIFLDFDYKGSGLVAKGDERLRGFAIAGDDGKYVWAEAEIVTRSTGLNGGQKQQVIQVHSPQIANPKSVKYGWADNPDAINLYNKEGLPASPFSTD
jgi:sialate O-acetylesterase